MHFSIFFLDSSVGIPIDIPSSVAELNTCPTTAVTKTYNSINVIKRKSMAKKKSIINKNQVKNYRSLNSQSFICLRYM